MRVLTPALHVQISRLELSIVPDGDMNRKHFTMYVEKVRRGWVVHDGACGYDSSGVPHFGEPRHHPLEDVTTACELAERLVPDMEVNGVTALQYLHARAGS